MGRFAKPSRLFAILAALGAFPGCHGSSIPIGDFAGSGDSFGILLCIFALLAAGSLLARWARD